MLFTNYNSAFNLSCNTVKKPTPYYHKTATSDAYLERWSTYFYYAQLDRKYCNNDLSKAHIISKIIEAITLIGWSIQTCGNNLDDKPVCDIYAQKGAGKIAINVCFDAIDMTEIKQRQADLKEGGVRGLWLVKPHEGAICDLNDRANYSSSQIPMFYIMQNTGASLICGIQYFDDGSLSDESSFHDITLDPFSFANFLFKQEIAFKPEYDNEAFFHCATQEKTCFKCKKNINTVVKVIYTRRILGQFISEDYSQACDIRGVPESEIGLINNALSGQYNFAPIKRMFSKFLQDYYMANSCSHCGVIMGAFFESTDYYAPVTFTEKVKSGLSANICFWDNELDNGTGAWMLDADSAEARDVVEDLLDLEIINFNENYNYPLWFSLLALPDGDDEDDDEDLVKH